MKEKKEKEKNEREEREREEKEKNERDERQREEKRRKRRKRKTRVEITVCRMKRDRNRTSMMTVNVFWSIDENRLSNGCN